MLEIRTRLTVIVLAVAGILLLPTSPISGQCTALTHTHTAFADSIGLLYDDDLAPAVIDGAIGMWRSCSNATYDFPAFVNGSGGTRNIHIRYVAGSSRSNRCGQLVGNEIVLYRSAVGTGGRPRVCGSVEQNLAHELGHVLGLQDTSGRGPCRHYIMAHISPMNRHSRSVHADECRTVGQRWLMFAERGGLEVQAIRTAP